MIGYNMSSHAGFIRFDGVDSAGGKCLYYFIEIWDDGRTTGAIQYLPGRKEIYTIEDGTPRSVSVDIQAKIKQLKGGKV